MFCAEPDSNVLITVRLNPKTNAVLLCHYVATYK